MSDQPTDGQLRAHLYGALDRIASGERPTRCPFCQGQFFTASSEPWGSVGELPEADAQAVHEALLLASRSSIGPA